jgi:sulfur-oxidizing protein SoxY
MKRREFAVALAVFATLPEARATDAAMRAAIRAYTAGLEPREPQPGPLHIEIAALVENGNAVPVRLWADAPVLGLALFTSGNPEPEVIHASFAPDCPRHELGTRIRLARSQQIVAVARAADGRCWQAGVDVIVTLAACVE